MAVARLELEEYQNEHTRGAVRQLGRSVAEDLSQNDMPFMLAIASQIVGPFEAPDIVQDSLIKIMDQDDRVFESSAPRGVAKKIVFSKAVDQLRSKGAESRAISKALALADFWVSNLYSPSAEAVALQKIRDEQSQAKINNHPEFKRHLHGESCPEIARKFNKSLEAVTSRIHMSRAKLKKEIEEEMAREKEIAVFIASDSFS